MTSERASAEKNHDVNGNRATDVSDESEGETKTPSVAAVENSLQLPRDVLDEHPETPVPLAAMPSQGMPTPPNGGLAAWLQVLGAFFVYFNTWSVGNDSP